jgi:hypothetical protein
MYLPQSQGTGDSINSFDSRPFLLRIYDSKQQAVSIDQFSSFKHDPNKKEKIVWAGCGTITSSANNASSSPHNDLQSLNRALTQDDATAKEKARFCNAMYAWVFDRDAQARMPAEIAQELGAYGWFVQRVRDRQSKFIARCIRSRQCAELKAQ